VGSLWAGIDRSILAHKELTFDQSFANSLNARLCVMSSESHLALKAKNSSGLNKLLITTFLGDFMISSVFFISCCASCLVLRLVFSFVSHGSFSVCL